MKRVIGLVFAIWFFTSMSYGQAYLVCRLRTHVSADTIATRYGLTYLDRTNGHPFYLFGAPSLGYIETMECFMSFDPDIVWSDEDMEIADPESHGLLTEATSKGVKKGSTLPAVGARDTLYAQNDNFLRQVGFSPILATMPGRTVKVAVLDTGLTPTAGYLWDKTVAAVNFVEQGKFAYDQPMDTDTDGDGELDEGTGHGSMVAGLVDQLAPQTQLVIARVSDSDGFATVWTLVKGLCFAVDQKCEVANISFGTLAELPAMKQILDWCDSKGLLVVCPAGNDNVENLCYPAKLDDAISVAGLLPDNEKAPFSNYSELVNFSAPATGIASAWWDGDWATWSGTSLASPIVAGIIADCLRRSVYPLEPAEIRELIRETGISIDDVNPDYEEELGRLINHSLIDEKLNDADSP